MGICCCLLDPQTNSYQAEVCRSSIYSRQTLPWDYFAFARDPPGIRSQRSQPSLTVAWC